PRPSGSDRRRQRRPRWRRHRIQGGVSGDDPAPLRRVSPPHLIFRRTIGDTMLGYLVLAVFAAGVAAYPFYPPFRGRVNGHKPLPTGTLIAALGVLEQAALSQIVGASGRPLAARHRRPDGGAARHLQRSAGGTPLMLAAILSVLSGVVAHELAAAFRARE